MKCNECNSNPCGCGKPFLGIEAVPDRPTELRYNINGLTATYDHNNVVYQGQTDTSLNIDSINRVIKYMAERHIDTITAKELGSILHLSDIGDVDTEGTKNGSMLVYKKDSNCSEGCEGVNNAWEIWNSLDKLETSLTYAGGYDAQGQPISLNTPAHTNNYYLLGWNGGSKLSYYTIPKFTDKTNKKPLYVDTTTGQIGWMES